MASRVLWVSFCGTQHRKPLCGPGFLPHSRLNQYQPGLLERLSWSPDLSLTLLLFSQSVMSDSLQPHGLQHVRLPCPSSSPGVCSNSDAIQSSHPLCCPLLFLPSIFPSIRIFSMSQLIASGGQSVETLASVPVLPMSIQSWFPLGLTGGWKCFPSVH